MGTLWGKIKDESFAVGRKASSEILKSAIGSLAGLVVGACASLAILAVTRPDVETANVNLAIESLTLAQARLLNPKAQYDKLSVTFAKNAIVGIANESAIIVSGVANKKDCVKQCDPMQMDRFVGLVGPARKNWIDAVVGRSGQLEVKALILFPEIGSEQAQFSDFQAIDLNTDGSDEIFIKLIYKFAVGEGYASLTFEQSGSKWKVAFGPSLAKEAKAQFKLGITNGKIKLKKETPAEEASDIPQIAFPALSTSGQTEIVFYGRGSDLSLLDGPEGKAKYLAVKAGYNDDCLSCDRRAYFKPFKYANGQWASDEQLYGGKGIVYVNPLPLNDISPKSFFDDMVASLKVAGMINLGTRLAIPASCKTLK